MNQDLVVEVSRNRLCTIYRAAIDVLEGRDVTNPVLLRDRAIANCYVVKDTGSKDEQDYLLEFFYRCLNEVTCMRSDIEGFTTDLEHLRDELRSERGI